MPKIQLFLETMGEAKVKVLISYYMYTVSKHFKDERQ